MRECTSERLNREMDSPLVKKVCAEIASAREAYLRGDMSKDKYETYKSEQKKRLPILTPHATFKNGQRLNAQAVPSGLSMFDIDHIADPRGRWAQIEPRKEELGILLAHVTPSMEGLRLLFVIPQGMTLPEAQAWMAHQLGDAEYDACTKDYARSSFVVPREYLLYLSEKLWSEPQSPCGTCNGTRMTRNERMNTEELKDKNICESPSSQCTPCAIEEPCGTCDGTQMTQMEQMTADKELPCSLCHPEGTEGSVNGSRNNEKSGCTQILHSVNSAQDDKTMEEENNDKSASSAKSAPKKPTEEENKEKSASEKSENLRSSATSASSACHLEYHGLPATEIVQKYWELNNDGLPPTQGDRNTKIFDLACSLRHIFNFDRELLNRAIPNYDGFPQEEKMQCIDNALREPRKYMPMKLTRVLQALKAEQSKLPSIEGGDGGGSACPPPMPSNLPPLIAHLVSRTPDLYKPAVAHAVFPSLGAHLHRVTFRYIDNVAHEATLMNVLMAGTGAGKDCISQPINYIMADIRRRDEENLRREREWKNEVNSKGANKDKRQRPEGLVIQEIDADMTNPAFVMRTAEADEHFLYTKMNEIDQFDALRGNGRGGQQFQIMCLAFDPGNRYGQTRVGAGSVTEKVTIRFNWNASTTILKGQRYFRTVLTDGPISRINFCTIPEREIGAEMPVYGTYDEAFAEELRPYIERLTKATGEVDCPEAYRLAMELREECADRARLTQSRVYENLSFRANVIAYLKACLLYVAHGCQWSQEIEDFIRWSLHYDLWCKMEFFGSAIEESMSEGGSTRRKPGPRNLLELLPDTFTVNEAMDVRRSEGITGGERETRHMLAMWKMRKYVSQITDNSYMKVA